jgi:uncharacterized RDD family membrane protein YckC
VILAGRLRRLFATLIDAIAVPALTILLVMIAGVLEDAEDYTNRLWMLWIFVLAVLSYLLLNGYWLWRRGQTLGKRLLGIAIVGVEAAADETPTAEIHPAPWWKLICLRALFFPLLFVIVVPWLAVLPVIDQLFIFGKTRRCLHDYVAGTRVVRLGKRPGAAV